MVKKITVYTDDLGKFLWEEGKLLEARRTPDQEEGFIIPITIIKENIVCETSENIIDIKRKILRNS